MNIPTWAALKKEHKQTVLLIAMWLLGSLFALYQFVLAPFFQNRSKSTTELDDLRTQIGKAEVAMQGESKLRREYANMIRKSQVAADEYVVPIENPLSWVTEKVYTSGRKVGVDVQSVAELGGGAPGWEGLTKAERTFKPYSVRIVTECSYPQLLDFIRALEDSNPHICVSGISVSANDSNPTRHQVNLVAEWPMWGRRVEFGLAKQRKPAENVAE